MKVWSIIFTALIMLFLFAPILILLVFSFNGSNSLSVFSEPSLFWYRELFKDSETLGSLRNTLILALSASVISTVLGTAAAVGINSLRNKFLKTAIDTTTNIPMVNPDIITGISLMLMFVFVGRLFGASSSLNFGTMLIAHITFCLPYVILQVIPKLKQMDKALPEAAMDLGCTPVGAFFKVVLPDIMPGVITGLLMAFTLSLDDFVISYFTVGNDFQTLPIRIYNMTKKTVTPKMYALATIIFFAILILLIFTNLSDEDANSPSNAKRAERKSRRVENRKVISPKVYLSAAAAVLVAVIILIAALGTGRDTLTLNVYNWGEYISDGSEDSLDTISAFEDWYLEEYGQKVKVNYTTFSSNEDMYSKIKSGAVSFDVIVPSDYMIARMKDEGLLLPLDFGNIPNYENIDEGFKGLYYDENNEYTVPYTYGVIGIIYNANKVDEADVTGWDILWNEKYSGQILQINNPRDAFGIAQYKLGYDVNDTDPELWDAAFDELLAQRPLVKSYVMDEIYNMMESGEADIAAYYAGDYFTMVDAEAEDVDLRFFTPEYTNFFIDAMCIPSCCENKELAEIFINWMLSEEPAVANAEYICYACPNSVVFNSEEYIEDMGEEAIEVLYPGVENFAELYNKTAYKNLDQDALAYMNTLWENLKVN